MSTSYKVVLVGNDGVGKTCMVDKLHGSHFDERYVATLGVEVHPITFYTNHGPITLNIWDTAGQERYGGIREGYLHQADAAIVMFSVNHAMSAGSVPMWFRMVRRSAGSIPTVILGNKNELSRRIVRNPTIHRELASRYGGVVHYHEFSVKLENSMRYPLLLLARDLTGYTDLVFY